MKYIIQYAAHSFEVLVSVWEGGPPGEPFAVNGSAGASPSRIKCRDISKNLLTNPNLD